MDEVLLLVLGPHVRASLPEIVHQGGHVDLLPLFSGRKSLDFSVAQN